MEFPKLTKEMAMKVDKFTKEEMERIEKEEPRFIRLDLLNDDYFDIAIDDIESMELENVYTNHQISEGFKLVERHKFCQKSTIVLPSFIRDKYFTHRNKISIFDRLISSHDIANITYLNGYKEHLERIYMPWDDHNEKENDYHKVSINRSGDLVITIIKGEER